MGCVSHCIDIHVLYYGKYSFGYDGKGRQNVSSSQLQKGCIIKKNQENDQNTLQQ